MRVLQLWLEMQVLIKTDWCSRHVIVAQKKRHRVRGGSGRCRPIPHFVKTSPISPLERFSAYARGFLTSWKRENFYRDINNLSKEELAVNSACSWKCCIMVRLCECGCVGVTGALWWLLGNFQAAGYYQSEGNPPTAEVLPSVIHFRRTWEISEW